MRKELDYRNYNSTPATNKEYQPKILFCPECGTQFNEEKSFILEYWNADLTIHFCWCHKCEWKGEIIKIDRIVSTELDD